MSRASDAFALTSLLCVAAMLGPACAAEPLRLVGTSPTVLWERPVSVAPIAPPAPMSRDEAVGIALAHDAAHRCELTARALRQRDRESGFAVMEQCVLRPDFTDLETLIAPPWIDDMRAHPDAARLVAHVIAARGGDVQHDLRLCRRAKLPLFSLRAAVEEPDTYRGRFVLMLGTPREGRTSNSGRTVELTETRIMAESEWVAAGPRMGMTSHGNSEDERTGAPRVQLREAMLRSEGQRVEILHNVSVETGHEILAEVGDDPFLESGTDYVLLLRFDGTREAVAGSVVIEKPVATLVDSFEPSSGLFARLGR